MSRSSFGWCILALGLHGIARAQPYYGDSGQWGSSFNVTQLGEHVILLPNSGYGKVLIFGPETTSPTQAAQYQVVSLDANGNLSTQTVPRPGLGETHQRCSGYMSTLAYFNCAGHSSLANGEVLICGGSPAVGDLPCELIPGAPGYDAALRACYDNPGNHYAYTFNPQNLTSPWTRKADIPGITGDPDTQFAISHWKYYPTLTTLWDGRVLLTSGRPSSSSIDPPPTGGYSCNYCVLGSGICKFCCEDDYPLVFDPSLNQPFGLWRRMSPTVHDRKPLAVYPFFFQTTRGNGYAFMAGGSYFHDENDSPNPDFDDETHRKTWQLDVDPAVEDWVGDDIGKGSSHDPVDPGGGAVMYAPDKILKGGANVWSFADPTPQTGDQDNNMYLINMSATTPQWTEIDPLIAVRRQFHLVALPDGRVLAVGGQDRDAPNETCFSPVYATEWIDPDDAQDEWAALADMPATYTNPDNPLETFTNHRSYHSGAVLMPDASVLLAGGQFDLNCLNGYADPGEFTKARTSSSRRTCSRRVRTTPRRGRRSATSRPRWATTQTSISMSAVRPRSTRWC